MIHILEAINLFKKFADFNHKKTRDLNPPQISSIEITNDCNLNCRMCAREAVKEHRGIGYMRVSDFRNLIQKNRQSVVHPRLFLHGEPLLHPYLADMIQICKQAGAKSVGFTTNGTLLHHKYFLKLVEAGLTVVCFSFEGVTPKVYEYFRRGAHYETTYRNILFCAVTKTQHKLPVHLSINIIDNELTRPHLKNFISFWENINGIDAVYVSELGDWHDTVDVKAWDPVDLYKPVKICPAAWHIVNIQYDGGVVPCCLWLHKPIGNIFEKDLMEIWNGPQYVTFRERMAQGRDHVPYCKDCKANPFPPGSPYLCQPNKYYPLSKNALDLFIKRPVLKRVNEHFMP